MGLNTAAARDEGLIQGIQRSKLCVYDFYASTGNHIETFPSEMRELFFANDSKNEMSVQVVGPASLNIVFVLKGGETIDERLPVFTGISITTVSATDAWRFYPRSALIP
jgi:hypothetical protein